MIRFLWWNVESLAHFDPDRRLQSRWPESTEAYAEKAKRVDRVLSQCAASTGGFEIIALAEITKQAAEDLRDRMFPNYKVESLDLFPNDPDFEVSVLFPDSPVYTIDPPLVTPNTPRGTRPMAVLNAKWADEHMQFIFAHWPAPFAEEGRRTQEKMAEYLNTYLFDFLDPQKLGLNRHAIVMGDFNCEPFQELTTHFDATRNRSRAMSHHYTDRDVKRVRLYNCSWRLLGERVPHGPLSRTSVAGSYYWSDRRTWHTVDQVLVSGSLLTTALPYFNEESLTLLHPDGLLDDEGFPRKFEWKAGRPIGISDHLPVTGTVVLKD